MPKQLRHSSFMGEIHEFILERVHEDGLAALASLKPHARDEPHGNSRPPGQGPSWGPRRTLAECEIKSEIVDIHTDGACPHCLIDPEYGCETIRLLAQAWQKHPSYRPEWDSFHDVDSEMSRTRATRILEDLRHPGCPPPVKLTQRETEVLQLIADGVSYRDIGKYLYISLNTVKNHVRNTVKKSRFHRRLGDSPGPAGWPA